MLNSVGDLFDLPDPITTPGYVPTPPSAKINQISVKGATSISFSEPVFEIDDIKSKTVKVPKMREEYFRSLQVSLNLNMTRNPLFK